MEYIFVCSMLKYWDTGLPPLLGRSCEFKLPVSLNPKAYKKAKHIMLTMNGCKQTEGPTEEGKWRILFISTNSFNNQISSFNMITVSSITAGSM